MTTLFLALSVFAAAPSLKGSWKQLRIECADNAFTITGAETNAALADGRVHYVSRIGAKKIDTLVKAWPDAAKKADYCELTTTESWSKDGDERIFVSDSKLVKKGRGAVKCEGTIEKPRKRSVQVTLKGDELRMIPADGGREMKSDEKPADGFCSTGNPTIVYRRER